MRFTLITDGVSDQALIPLLIWTIRQSGVVCDLQPQWADFRNLPRRPTTLAEKIRLALDLFPCDLLFVHRDAENETWDKRRAEIAEAINEIAINGEVVPNVYVIPVRMQEAWLLFDEQAIRSASGNPNGTIPLELPRLRDCERIPDPKELLFNLIRTASELNARRLRRLSVSHARGLVSGYITDFSPLRELAAFAALETDLRTAVIVGRFAEWQD